MQVNFPDCPSIQFENWYARPGPGAWGFDVGFNVQPQYFGGPAQGTLSSPALADIGTWIPTGLWNTTRRMELAWYRDRYLASMSSAGLQPFQVFYATQFGDLVSGPNDEVCGTNRTIGGKTYTVLCLEQFVASSLTTIAFGVNGGNAVDKSYPSVGLMLPN
jgi:hypothetical protein